MTNINQPLQRYFLGWQCRIRQQAVRNDEGRPSEGMLAEVYVSISERNLGPLVTNIALSDTDEITSEFRHVVKKTHDPKLRRDSALKILRSAYYQYPAKFDGMVYASLALDSELAELLVKQQQCRLVIRQYNQSFDLTCAVTELPEDHAAYQVTYWHNKMFNATMPARVRILQFAPDWENS
ncbi:MAG: hypothetical protein AAF404_22765, partial [Pseudomonadota bacterium]